MCYVICMLGRTQSCCEISVIEMILKCDSVSAMMTGIMYSINEVLIFFYCYNKNRYGIFLVTCLEGSYMPPKKRISQNQENMYVSFA